MHWVIIYRSYLIYFFANAIILLCFFFLFLVNFSNDLLIPVPIVNIKVNETRVMPAGIPTTEAYEAILNVPNYADTVINIYLNNQN